MYITGAIGLLLVVVVVELEMGIAKYMTNYLSSIVSYKFGNLYIYCNYCKLCNYHNLHIYCNYCKLCNYHNLHIYHNNHLYKLYNQFDRDNQLKNLYNHSNQYKFDILYTKYSYYSSRNFDKD